MQASKPLDSLSQSFATLSLVRTGDQTGRPRSVSDAKDSPREFVHIDRKRLSSFPTEEAFRKSIPFIRFSDSKLSGNAISCHSINNYGITLVEHPECNEEGELIRCTVKGETIEIKNRDAYYDKETKQIFSAKDSSFNADEVFATKIASYECFVLADGCGWGKRSQLAAQTVVKTSLAYLQTNLPSLKKNTRVLAHTLLDALHDAQAKLLALGEDKAGDTTFLAGCVRGNQLVVVSVGDCKAFLLRKVLSKQNDQNPLEKTLSCIDILPDDRPDGANPGGCLSSTNASLQNLTVAIVELIAGDIIVACSDGVSDNIATRAFAQIAGDEPSKIISNLFTYCAENCFGSKLYLLENTGRVPYLSNVKPDHASVVVFKYDPNPLKKTRGSHLGETK